MAFEHTEHIYGLWKFSSNVEILALTKTNGSHKWLYIWNYRQFFSSVNFVCILGIHIPCLDASQTLIGSKGAKIFIQSWYTFSGPIQDLKCAGTGLTGV